MDRIPVKKFPKRILVIKPSSLGDVIHSLPFLTALWDCFPSAGIDWVIAKGLEGIFKNHPMVRKLWVINKDQWKRLANISSTAREMGKLFADLKNENYDIVIDLQGLLRSGIITKATCAPLRIGFKEAREGSRLFYTHRIEGGREIHAVDRYLRITHAVGCETEKMWFPMPLIKESEKIKGLKSELGTYAVIVPGARWETKRWPYENFGRLASKLRTKSVIVGSASDAAIARDIVSISNGKAVSMAGQTDIRELISIIRGADFVISNDSGPMHIAAAFGIPVVALFGPTNPVRTGPYGEKHVVLNAGLKCAPCYKKRCATIKCLKDISVDKAYDAVKAVIKEEG